MPISHALRERTLAPRQDRRRHQRLKLNLLGRFMLEDRREYPCQTVDMSPGSAALMTPVPGRLGERVVAYIDHVGRIDGEIVRIFEGGFAMTVNGTVRRKDQLAAKLTWLGNRNELNLTEDRAHERLTPVNPVTILRIPDGREYYCPILDLSLSGAALAIESKPPIGSAITVGKLRATVVRHFDEGIGVQFKTLQTRESIEENLV
jgi:PilZ domain-containing protein